MKNFIKFIIIAILFVVCTIGSIYTVTKFKDNEYRVSAYVAVNEESTAASMKLENVTNVYIAFAYIDENNRITLENQKTEDKEKREENADKVAYKIRMLREMFPDKKIAIAVGGHGADGFSDMASTEESRKEFVASVKEFIIEYDLDGVDIDWESPVTGGGGVIKCMPEDKENFTYLLEALRDGIDELKVENKKEYELSFAQISSEDGLKNIELNKINSLVDAINLMSYDYTGTWSDVTGHNSNLYKSEDKDSQICTDDIIKRYEEIGISLNKIILGIPIYGQVWSGVESTNNGLYQKAEKSHDPIRYKDIKNKYLWKNNFERYWDESAKVPYLYNGDMFIAYDDVESVRIKSEYVRKKKLGGVMVWEYTQDDNEEIIKSIYEVLKRK